MKACEEECCSVWIMQCNRLATVTAPLVWVRVEQGVYVAEWYCDAVGHTVAHFNALVG